MNVFLATANEHKLEELRALLRKRGLPLEVESAVAVGGMPEVDESAGSFAGNAELKAAALVDRLPLGAWVLADDSGLEVAAMGGEPGVRSARFAGLGATDAQNLLKVLKLMEGEENRSARFVCVLCLKSARGTHFFEGYCEGTLLEGPVGQHGFGYDPIFKPDGFEQSFAELGAEVKSRLSHRARAVAALADWVAGKQVGDCRAFK